MMLATLERIVHRALESKRNNAGHQQGVLTLIQQTDPSHQRWLRGWANQQQGAASQLQIFRPNLFDTG